MHIAFYIQADDFFLGIGADSDGLAEMSRKLAGAVVSHCDFTAFARLDRSLRILRNGASARSNGLVNDQKIVSCIGEFECQIICEITIDELKAMIDSI